MREQTLSLFLIYTLLSILSFYFDMIHGAFRIVGAASYMNTILGKYQTNVKLPHLICGGYPPREAL